MTYHTIFKNMAEVMDWAKKQFPGCSFSVEHLEANRWVVIVKGKGMIQRQVVYVKWEGRE